MSDAPIKPKNEPSRFRTVTIVILAVVILVFAGLACILVYALPLSKIRVGHLSLEVPEGCNHSHNDTDGSLTIYSPDFPEVIIAFVYITSWKYAIDNDTLYNQTKATADGLNPPFTATPLVAPYNRTIDGAMANEGLFGINYFGGYGFYRIVVIGSSEWHTIWRVEMREVITGPIHDLHYNDTPLAPTFDSIVDSIRIEGRTPILLLVTGMACFIVAGIVILLVIKAMRGRGRTA